jgi:hypothetical protein
LSFQRIDGVPVSLSRVLLIGELEAFMFEKKFEKRMQESTQYLRTFSMALSAVAVGLLPCLQGGP